MTIPNGQQPIPVDVRGLPRWLQAAVFLGVPSVIAMFLVYSLTVQTSHRINEIERLIALQQATMQQLQTAATQQQATASAAREHFDQVLAMDIKAIRQLCVAISSTPEQRAACFRETSLPEEMRR